MKTVLATGKIILLLAGLQKSKSVTFSPQVVCGIKKAVLADGKLSLHEDKLFAGGNGNILLSVKPVNIGEKICFHIGILKTEADSLMEFYLTDRVAHQTGDWPTYAAVITQSYHKISVRSCIYKKTAVWTWRFFQIASNRSGELSIGACLWK